MRPEQAQQLLRQQLLFARRHIDASVDGPAGLGAKQASLLALNVGLVVYIDVVCGLQEKTKTLSRTRSILLAKASRSEMVDSEDSNVIEILSLFQQSGSWLCELALVVDSVYEHPALQEQSPAASVAIIASTGSTPPLHWSKVERDCVQGYVNSAQELLQRHADFGCEY